MRQNKEGDKRSHIFDCGNSRCGLFSLFPRERNSIVMSITQDSELIYKYELKIHQYEMERMYEDELFSNAYLSPAHKIVLRAIRQIIRTLRIDDTIPTPIHLTELSNKTAISTAQLKRLIDQLDEWGIITKETIKWKEGKAWKSEMRLKMGGQIKSSPQSITTPRNKPGGDQTCHKCGSKNIEPIAYVCNDCGHYGSYD
jgi:DNA-binding MarR family transcriptional regulator